MTHTAVSIFQKVFAALLFILGLGLVVATGIGLVQSISSGDLCGGMSCLLFGALGLATIKFSRRDARRKRQQERELAEKAASKSTPRFDLDVTQCHFAEPLMDIRTFYAQFRNNATPPKRDQFETDDEYIRRLPKPLDVRQQHFIRLPARASDSFHYDIATQLLTVYGGRPVYDREEGRITNFNLDYEFQHIRKYKAQNHFGALFSVEESRTIHYEMHLEGGLSRFAPLLREKPGDTYHSKYFAISLPMERDLAREQAPTLSLVLGVRLISWERSKFSDYTDTQDVTSDRPKTEHSSYYTIDARFASLHLVNCDANTQFAVYCDKS